MNGNNGPSDPRLEAMLAEYQTLRQESLQAISNRLTVMSFTFAALSVLVAGVLSSKVDALTGAVALVFLPQLSKAALMIWLGEYARSQRAGRYLAELETRVNTHVGQQVVGWESRLATGSVHMAFPYRSVAVLLLGVGYTGAVLGIYFLYERLHSALPGGGAVLFLGGIADLVVVLESWFLQYFFQEWRYARTGQQSVGRRKWGLTLLAVVLATAATVILFFAGVDASGADGHPPHVVHHGKVVNTPKRHYAEHGRPRKTRHRHRCHLSGDHPD
jgi:hypothetical protein